MFTRFIRLFTKGYIHQSNSNNCQKESNLSLSYSWSQINHNSSDNPSVLTAKYHATIALTKFSVNISGSLVPNGATNHTTTRFEQIAENTLSCGLLGSNDNFIYTDINKDLRS